jgi:hypothetical protein
MSETAKHRTEEQDASLQVINALSVLDARNLSFIQLRRLQKALEQACADVADETARRSEADASGDTVRVPSPNL